MMQNSPAHEPDSDAVPASIARGRMLSLSGFVPPPGPGHDLVVPVAGVCTAVLQWLEAFGRTRIDCGFDADSAGDQAADALARRETMVRRLRPECSAKDWNDRIRYPEIAPGRNEEAS